MTMKLPEGVKPVGENKYQCSCCGYRWKSLLKDLSCPKCKYIAALERSNLTSESKFHTRRSRVHVVCRKCGYGWDTRADAIMKGRLCYHCKFGREMPKRNSAPGFKTRKTTEEYAAQLLPMGISLLGEYRSSGGAVKLKCMREGCGHEWGILPKRLSLTPGCPKCSIGNVNYYQPCTLYFLRLKSPDGQDLFKVGTSTVSLKCAIPPIFRGYIQEVQAHEKIETGREAVALCSALRRSFAEYKYRGLPFFGRDNTGIFTEDIYLHYQNPLWILS